MTAFCSLQPIGLKATSVVYGADALEECRSGAQNVLPRMAETGI